MRQQTDCLTVLAIYIQNGMTEAVCSSCRKRAGFREMIIKRHEATKENAMNFLDELQVHLGKQKLWSP